jgi:peptide/nickel transport system permease protein
MATAAVTAGRTRIFSRLYGRIGHHSVFDWVVYVLVAGILILAIVGPWIAPSSISQSDIQHALKAPSAEHWFGTDDQGRDVFWRVIAGTRVSVASALAVVAAFALISIIVATIATAGGRWLDGTVMGICDIGLALPPIVIALGFAAALGGSLQSAIIAMIIAAWPVSARLLRSVMRETSQKPYVNGARVLGVSRTRLMMRHVLPNSLDVLWVKWAADVGAVIVILAGLSFIGVGAQPPSPEWGAMIASGQAYVATAWWTVAAPGLALVLVASVFGLLGETLQARLDPSLR